MPKRLSLTVKPMTESVALEHASLLRLKLKLKPLWMFSKEISISALAYVMTCSALAKLLPVSTKSEWHHWLSSGTEATSGSSTTSRAQLTVAFILELLIAT
ncbi:hypothetical protein PV04_10324 [Phialophora macrospora]|uniref:Uncharacterized protein n=1 Tax=Phialophora macrospora TaxID=1851006 RepID=A0A0D2DMC7_9EURO|nr:hypothetical protein PV04_10324 [Phialophora macrospora]